MIKVLHPFNFNRNCMFAFRTTKLALRDIVFEACMDVRKECCRSEQNLPLSAIQKVLGKHRLRGMINVNIVVVGSMKKNVNK